MLCHTKPECCPINCFCSPVEPASGTLKLAAPNPSGHPAETVPRLVHQLVFIPISKSRCMSRPREPSGGAQKPGRGQEAITISKTWGQSPLPPSDLTPCLGTVRGAWPFPHLHMWDWGPICGQPSMGGTVHYGHLRGGLGGREQSQAPARLRVLSGGALGAAGGLAVEYTLVCGVCMKNIGQTLLPSGAATQMTSSW